VGVIPFANPKGGGLVGGKRTNTPYIKIKIEEKASWCLGYFGTNQLSQLKNHFKIEMGQNKGPHPNLNERPLRKKNTKTGAKNFLGFAETPRGVPAKTHQIRKVREPGGKGGTVSRKKPVGWCGPVREGGPKTHKKSPRKQPVTDKTAPRPAVC